MGGTRFTFTTPSPACTNTGTGGMPGPRVSPVRWTDPSGNFWLFGGSCGSSVATYRLNDLWRFAPGQLAWTLVSGSAQPSAPGSYGTKGTPDAGNHPGGRDVAAGWTDSSGNLWLHGGYGHDSKGDFGALNDLWRFSPASGAWTWMSGSDLAGAAGIYGTQGAQAAGNAPAANANSVAWTDAAGNLWLFGGDDGSDLWEYVP
jgi:hypothetical protein